jgi:hypothetical protein
MAVHDSLLRRSLAYVAGALAGFLPLFEFIIQSHQAERLLLPWPFDAIFVVIVSLLSVALTWAALSTFFRVAVLERRLGIDPDSFDEVRKAPGLMNYLASLFWGRLDDTSLDDTRLARVLDGIAIATLVFVILMDVSLFYL